MSQTPQELLAIISDPKLEDALSDWLLARRDISGFSSQTVYGHSEVSQQYSLAEQVSGRQRRLMFHVHAAPEVIDALLRGLRQDFKGSRLHYWRLPLIAAGTLE
jgi:hypothetical protein